MAQITVVDESLMTPGKMLAYFKQSPMPKSDLDLYCPLQANLTDGNPEKMSWRVMKNASHKKNLVAPGNGLNSKIPARGRPTFSEISGNFFAIADAFEMTKSDFADYERLKAIFKNTQNPAIASQLLKFWDDPIDDLRRYPYNFRLDASYKLFTGAGEFSINSEYYSGMKKGAYPVKPQQKVNTAMSWDNEDAKILKDIETNFITLPKTLGMLPINFLHINDTVLRQLQKNKEIRQQVFARVSVNTALDGVPSLEEINKLLETYFSRGSSIVDVATAPKFVVISDTLVTDAGVSYNPFADNRVIGTQELQWGHFEYVPLKANPNPDVSEVNADWLLFGMYETVSEVRYQKTYVRGFGYPVLDSWEENVYLKTDGTPW